MSNATKQKPKLVQFFLDLSITKKLLVGFGSVIFIVICLVAYIERGLFAQEQLQNRVVDLRMPTNAAGLKLVNGINHSLAALRGFMLLNNDKFKEQRQVAWQNIEENMAIMKEMSKNWTVPANVTKLEELETVIAEFKIAQQQVEDVSNTPDEQPAMKILLTEAAPKANKIVGAITGMINEEKKLAATPERKELLSIFADSRGSFAMGLASIRAFLISGDKSWSEDFERRWQVNTARLKSIQAKQGLLNAAQRKHFATYVSMREQFEPLPPRMFEIRGSEKWNMANYLLKTEAAARAERALGILSAMVANQTELVQTDAQLMRAGGKNIEVVAFVAAIIAVSIASLIGFLVSKSVANPLAVAIKNANKIAEGDLSNSIEIHSKDEIGNLLLSMKEMQGKIKQVLEVDIRKLLEDVKNGDLSGRINADDKNGFYKDLCVGINDLVQVNDHVVKDTVRMFGAMSEGNLSERISADYKGDFNKLKNDANDTVNKLADVIENEIQILVDSAKVGDLSGRIQIDDKTGFYKDLCVGINNLVEVNDHVVKDTVRMFGAMSQGKLSERIVADYKGDFNQLKTDANNTANKLADVIENEIQSLVDAAKVGDLSKRIQMSDKKGFFNTLSGSINELVAINGQVVDDTATMFKSMVAGDYEHRITNTYEGSFDELKENANKANENFALVAEVIEGEIQGLVNAASDGDLSQRIDTSDKSGFFKTLSVGINDMIDVNQRVIDDVVRVFTAMANGDLQQNISNEYRGAFLELKQNANQTLTTLQEIIEGDIQHLVNSAKNGDLSQRIDIENKSGFFKDLCSGINDMIDVNQQIIDDVSRVFEAVAVGDLRQSIDKEYSGSFDSLKQNINSTINKLVGVINQVNTAATSVATGANEISVGSNELSRRIQEQASSLEETAASMEEMLTVVRRNANNSRVACELSLAAQTKAEDGGTVAEKAVNGMEEITESSKKISEIMGVIDGIAFQTNLLALNAAVEAARAGEQGRGFAVVASEVRNLALRSANSAEEIQELIRKNVSNIQDGTSLVNQSAETLKDIVQSTTQANDMTTEISSATEEQTSGIEQVNTAVSQMDRVTQENATLVEESSSAASAVADQAKNMQELLSFFKLA